jgi:Holliday junction resolvase
MGKGSDAENELVNYAWDRGYSTLRSPGSGSVDRPSPDVIIIDSRGSIVATELKSTSDGTGYYDSHEIRELNEWTERAGGKAYAGVKPDMRSHDQWYFIPIDELHSTDSGNFSIRKSDWDNALSREEILPQPE